jgi:rubredoxin
MSNSRVLKAVVCGILCVVVGMIPSITGDVVTRGHVKEEQQCVNTFSDENSVICGYVHDSETGDPLANVNVQQEWHDSQGNYWSNYTTTDATGFYHLNTAAVTFRLYFYYEDYFRGYSPMMSIGENEILWYNVSLIPIPPVTVHFSGFITDNFSGEPIQDAQISLNWRDAEGHYWYNYTSTNSSGYYYIGAIPGETYIYVYKNNYYSYSSDAFFTENNSLVWFNVSLVPYPPVCAIICGYVTDAQNGDPLPDASVNLYCTTEYGQWHNSTHTNTIGFFSVGSIQGVVDLSAYKTSYSSLWVDNLVINENETRWVNLSLEYQPKETSLIQGYVVDAETSAVVRNAFVRFDWKDAVGHFYSKYTFTDQKGYYWINAPKGELQFLFTGNGYSNQQVAWFEINENAECWLNASLSPEITLVFSKPQPGVYINNESIFPALAKILSRFFPKSKPLIIGPLEIVVNITKSTLGCNRVEFYIDGSYRWTDSEAPFTYYWRNISFFTHVIRVIAYDNAGPCRIETLTVRKIL